MGSLLQVIYSETIKGSGLWIGVGYSTWELGQKNVPQSEMLQDMKDIAEGYETAGSIDALSNLANTPIWMYSGRQDDINPAYM